jgi:hypothetical protein
MRFSARSKVGILLSLVTILVLISAFAVTTFMGGHGASAAYKHSVVKHGQLVKSASHSMHVTKAVNHAVNTNAAKKFYALPSHLGKSKSTAKINAAKQQAPVVASPSALIGPRILEGGILHNFAGLTATESGLLEGVFVLPPDMALCAGHDASIAGNPRVEFQVINLAIAEYDLHGNVLTSALLPFGPDSMSNFFGEPGVPFFGGELVSDPNCIYDAASNTFFFEAIALDLQPPDFNTFTESHADLVVYNASTGDATLYRFDTSDSTNTGCSPACLGDQGKIGVDNHAVYISMDEFQSDLLTQNGAEFFAISKDQLVNQDALVSAVYFTNISINGVPVTSLQPAVSISSTDTEYLVNSFPFLDVFETPNPISRSLGFWTVTNDDDIPNLSNDVTLTGTVIASELYAYSVPAVSSGDGVVFASQIQNNDNRMMQCEYIGGNVWCSLETAVSVAGDPTTRDGIAWFKIGVHSQTVRKQGYIASPKNYLLFPSINVTTEGTVGIAFSITGPHLNPSAAYVVRKAGESSFGSIQRAFTAQSPSFNGDGNVRWGDYSRACLDLNGKDIWMATEYAEVPTDLDALIGLNDATRVWDVKGDQ